MHPSAYFHIPPRLEKYGKTKLNVFNVDGKLKISTIQAIFSFDKYNGSY
jgi:hypothetical protein